MSPSTVAIIGIVVLVALFCLRMPVAYTMALVGFVGFVLVSSLEGGLHVVAKDFWAIFSSYDLTVVPMFILMGSIAFYSGISSRLFDTTYKFLGHLRGGLTLATVAACAGFAAMCGSTNAEAAAMGKVTIPEMRRYNYNLSMATGCVAAAGSLGILIPPSGILIIYGVMVEESIGKLFAAGILPGILLSLLFMLTVYILSRWRPSLCPAGPTASWKERLISLGGMVEMILLAALVLGGLLIGWFTPTEAGAAGAAGALVIALARRMLSWQGFLSALAETTRITAMIFVIVAGATIFGRFMAVTRVPFELSAWVGGLDMSPVTIMAFIMLGYLIGGCFMDSLALITLTVPIVYPVILTLGFDSIWFGVIIVLVTEMGAITPPVGINVYVIHGVAPDVPLETIFKGIFPFLMAIIACVVILIIFPQIALFIPSLMTL